MTADTWRRRDGSSLTYFVRRGDVVVLLGGGDQTPEETLRRAAATLAPRPAALSPARPLTGRRARRW